MPGNETVLRRASGLVSNAEDKSKLPSKIATQILPVKLPPPSTDASILSTLSKPARGIFSAFPVLKEVIFNTSKLICTVMSLPVFKPGARATVMLVL